jgi:hypothetical protein
LRHQCHSPALQTKKLWGRHQRRKQLATRHRPLQPTHQSPYSAVFTSERDPMSLALDRRAPTRPEAKEFTLEHRGAPEACCQEEPTRDAAGAPPTDHHHQSFNHHTRSQLMDEDAPKPKRPESPRPPRTNCSTTIPLVPKMAPPGR